MLARGAGVTLEAMAARPAGPACGARGCGLHHTLDRQATRDDAKAIRAMTVHERAAARRRADDRRDRPAACSSMPAWTQARAERAGRQFLWDGAGSTVSNRYRGLQTDFPWRRSTGKGMPVRRLRRDIGRRLWSGGPLVAAAILPTAESSILSRLKRRPSLTAQ